MSKSINNVMLMGRLTRDPETRSTQSGKIITSFSLAVDRVGSTEITDFFEITAWEKLAELCDKYLKKGSKTLVQGRLQQDSWDDKETGKKRTKITITASDVTFLDSKQESSSSNGRISQNEVLEASGEFTKKDPRDVILTDIENGSIDLSAIPF